MVWIELISEYVFFFKKNTCCFSHWLRIAISKKTFTPANTGLDKVSHYPELGSIFKAAFVKSCSWFFAAKAVELSEKHPDEP